MRSAASTSPPAAGTYTHNRMRHTMLHRFCSAFSLSLSDCPYQEEIHASCSIFPVTRSDHLFSTSLKTQGCWGRSHPHRGFGFGWPLRLRVGQRRARRAPIPSTPHRSTPEGPSEATRVVQDLAEEKRNKALGAFVHPLPRVLKVGFPCCATRHIQLEWWM